MKANITIEAPESDKRSGGADERGERSEIWKHRS